MTPRRVIVSTVFLCAGLACIERGPVDTETGSYDTSKTEPRVYQQQSTPYFAVGYDNFIERRTIEGTCFTATSEDTMYFWDNDSCQSLILRSWNKYSSSNFCAMSTLLLDFATDSLPDNAIIDNVALNLYCRDQVEKDQDTQPDPLRCTDCELDCTAGPDPNIGTFYKPLNGIPGDSLTATKAIPWMAVAGELKVQVQGQHYGSAPQWFSYAVGNKVNVTGTSRYALDREWPQGTELVEWYYDSMEGSNPPRLEVKYTVPFSPCIDGEVQHDDSQCSSCSGSYFNDYTTQLTNKATRDIETESNCIARIQTVIAFDTSELVSGHTISSATLRFNVFANYGNNVLDPRISIYAKKQSLSCPTSLDESDFVGCGSYGSPLSTFVKTGTGEVVFTIPNADSNISKAGITKFVLLDATTFEGEFDLNHVWSFHSDTATTESLRPKLTVVYE